MLAGGPFGLGPLELILIIAVIVVLFGATRVADLGASLGKGIREFRKNVKEEEPEAPAATTIVADEPGKLSTAKCSNCGTLNAARAKHCGECGSSLVTPVG